MPTSTLTVESLQQFIEALPMIKVVLRADTPHYTILAINEAARQALYRGNEIIGLSLFQAFPVRPDDPEHASEQANVAASFETVIQTGESHTLPVQKYDITNPDGTYATRYWSITNTPVKDEDGTVTMIIQSIADISEQVSTQLQLQNTQAQLDAALSAGSVGTWQWDIPGNVVRTDKNLALMFGIPEEQATRGLPLETFVQSIYQDDRADVAAAIERAVAGGDVFEEEYRTTSADGTIRWVIARGRIERNKAGAAVSFPGVLVDITDRKRVEQELSDSQERLTFLAESMPQKIFMTMADGTSDYINPQWSQFTGLSTEQLQHGAMDTFTHPDDVAGNTRVWQKSIATGKPFQYEHRLRRADGIYRWHLTRARAQRDKFGKVVRWVGSSTDISDQKQAQLNQEFLSKASKILFSSLSYEKSLTRVAKVLVPTVADWCAIDLADPREPNGIRRLVVAHKDPAKVVFAHELERMYPAKGDEPTGVPNVLRTGNYEFYPQIDEMMLEVSITDPKRLKLMKSIGFSAAMIVPFGANGTVVGAITLVSAEQRRFYTKADLDMALELAERVGIAVRNAQLYTDAQQEIAKRTKLEADLRQANEKLEERVVERTRQLEESNASLAVSNRELQDFVYVASHDLQEPLRKIQAFGNLLQEEYGAQLQDGADYLERMRSAAARMSVLIEDLLAFSRVATRTRPFQPVNLDKIAREVEGDLETRIQNTKGTLRLHGLPTIDADPTQMRQLLQNLIANALKFHKPDVAPVVEVNARRLRPTRGRPGSIELTVHDNGIGFDAHHADKIFAVFQRLHGRDEYEGTGIGLAVCRKIVERHGGTIEAESIPGEGATFRIVLPERQKGDQS